MAGASPGPGRGKTSVGELLPGTKTAIRIPRSASGATKIGKEIRNALAQESERTSLSLLDKESQVIHCKCNGPAPGTGRSVLQQGRIGHGRQQTSTHSGRLRRYYPQPRADY